MGSNGRENGNSRAEVAKCFILPEGFCFDLVFLAAFSLGMDYGGHECFIHAEDEPSGIGRLPHQLHTLLSYLSYKCLRSAICGTVHVCPTLRDLEVRMMKFNEIPLRSLFF